MPRILSALVLFTGGIALGYKGSISVTPVRSADKGTAAATPAKLVLGIDHAARVLAENLPKGPPISGTLSVENVLNAGGIEQTVQMAHFIQNASSAELKDLIDRSRNLDRAVRDQAWLRWVEVDLVAALSHPEADSAWWAWAQLDPEAALSGAVDSADPVLLTSVIGSIGQSDPKRAVELLKHYPGTGSRQSHFLVKEGLAKTDLAAAVAFGHAKGIPVENEIKLWLRADAGAALVWARGLADPAGQRRMLDQTLACLTEKDPKAALTEISKMPPGKARATHIAQAIAALVREDPAAARAAVEIIPNPADRRRALAAMATAMVAKDPAAAVGLVKDIDWQGLSSDHSGRWTYVKEDGGLSTGNGAGNPAEDTVAQLITVAPSATAAALAALPLERGAPIAEAVTRWAAFQPEAASTWLKDLPPGPVKDEAIRGLTHWLTDKNPVPDYEAAIAWADAASGDEQNVMKLNTIMKWRNRDRVAARAALEKLSLDESVKTHYRNLFD